MGINRTLAEQIRKFTAVRNEDVTIASGASVSSAIFIGDMQPILCAVTTSTTWTAADIGLQVSDDDATYTPLTKNDNDIVKLTNVATTGARTYLFDPTLAWALAPWNYVRLASMNTAAASTANTAVNQGADRTLTVSLVS